MAEIPPVSIEQDDHDYPMVGETLGLWRLIGGLGRGGMGEVYEAEYDYIHILSLRYAPVDRERIREELESLPRAQQARLASEMLGTTLPADARFAIKVCNARSGTPGHRRFLQEAEVASRLGDHPYIVGIHTVNTGQDDSIGITRRFDLERGKYRDVAFMVMDLAKRTYDPVRLSIGEAVHLVRCIATALDHAHSRGVVHRDMKPENILGSVEHPLLTDFGIAKEMEQTEGLTRTGQIIGTLDYMSPEQATDAKRVDHRSDIYSLGVVLYEFATGGHLPYSHKQDRDSCLTAIRSEKVQPKWPREHCPGFPIGLERIVLKAMAHRMEDRYQAMSEFITDLDRYTRGEWISPIGRIRFDAWARFQVRRHPRLLWSTVLGTAACIAIGAALWGPRLLDAQRRGIEAQIQRVEAAVRGVERGGRMQLAAADDQAMTKLRQDMRIARESYPDLARRLEGVEQELLTRRWLRCDFLPRRPGSTGSPEDALAEFRRATGIQSGAWSLVADGLYLQDFLAIPLGPYGNGTCFFQCVIALPSAEGFRIEAREAGEVYHRAVWSIEDGLLRLSLAEDERPAAVLREERLSGNRLGIGIELGPQGVRSWLWDREARHAVKGLREGAPASLRLELPKGSVIQAIGIWPEARR